MYHLSTIAILLLSRWQWSTQAFTVPPRRRTSATTRLYYKDEKTVVANPVEEKVSTKKPPAPLTDAEKAQKTVKELTKTRPYPIFVAEKVAGTVERTVKSFGKMIKKDTSQDETTSILPRKKREKIVVLGVGWGSAALLADIDTDVYDVTVISPRNHFVFTPSKLYDLFSACRIIKHIPSHFLC